jgi:hypothetical protein
VKSKKVSIRAARGFVRALQIAEVFRQSANEFLRVHFYDVWNFYRAHSFGSCRYSFPANVQTIACLRAAESGGTESRVRKFNQLAFWANKLRIGAKNA